MTQLNSKALLVQLKISQWTARKYDKRVTKEAAENNNADMVAGRYNKSLLPMTDSLKQVHKKASTIRATYYENTLKWDTDGVQLLPTANYLDFMSKFGTLKNEYYDLVNKFVSGYSQHVEDAEEYLGDMYNPADYPSTAEIMDKFKMDMNVSPLPADDFRVEIGEADLAAIQYDVEQRVQAAQSKAMEDVWQRLYDKVEAIVERLSDPSALFKNSLIENAASLCELLPRLNFADDPELEAMRREVEAKLTRYSSEVVRNDPDRRREVAADAKDIANKMSVFMGGK